jgi:hypothetical protein
VIQWGGLSGYDDDAIYSGTVIKEAPTSYRIVYLGGSGDGKVRVCYADSANGTTWTNFQAILNTSFNGIFDVDNDDQTIAHPFLMKEGSFYKIFYQGMYTVSPDCKNWSRPVSILSKTIMGDSSSSVRMSIGCVIKDDKTYKCYFSYTNDYAAGLWDIKLAVLTMTDSANSGSSIVGTYTTEGTINFAIAATDSAVVFYEARALQQDWTRYNGNYQSSYTLRHVAENAVSTTMGTGGMPASGVGNEGTESYRDFAGSLALGAYNLLSDESYFNSSNYISVGDKVDLKTRWEMNTVSKKPKAGDYISLTSVYTAVTKRDAVIGAAETFSGDYVYRVDNFTGEAIYVLIGALAENKKELFMLASSETLNKSNVSINTTIAMNLIGRPLVK